MPPRQRVIRRRIPEGLFNDTPVRRGNAALTNIQIRNDVRLTANRREFRNLTPEQLLERQEDFYDLRERSREERGDRQAQINLRTQFRRDFQGLPVASVFFDRNDNARARPYDQQRIFNENQHWLFARLLSGNLRPEQTRTFTNPPVRGGRYRIEVEYEDVDENDRTRIIEVTIPNFTTYQEIERYVNDTPTLYWATRQDSDEMLQVKSIRIFPIMQWTGGRNPRLNRLLDGRAHCFFAPLIRFYNNKIEKGIRVKNYQTCVKSCEKFIEKYKDGVSKDDFEEISKKLKATFEIVDITGNTIWTNVSANSKADNTFKFIYSDFEHVNVDKCETVLSMIEDIVDKGFDKEAHEVGTSGKICKYLIGKDVQEVSENAMHDIFEFLKHNKLYFSFTSNSMKTVSSITTNGVKFVLQKKTEDVLREEFFDSIKDFKFSYGDDNPTYDIVKACYVQKIQFAYQKSPDNIDGLQEFDMIKAYTNSHSCKYYVEFPTVLNHMVDFAEDDEIDVYSFVKEHVGFYQIKIKSINTSDHLVEHLKRFGIESGDLHTYCFTSPMIMWLIDVFGCEIQLYLGAWSVKTKDIRFSDAIKNTKLGSGVSLYAQIVGIMASEPLTKSTYYYVNEDFTEEVSTLVEGSTFDYTPFLYDAGKSYGELRLDVPIKTKTNYLPIASYILQYTFINVFSEVINFHAEDIFAVKVDSILLKEGNTIMNNLFRKKDPKLLTAPIYDGYFQKYTPYNVNEWYMDGAMPIEEEFVIGQGGSGKTYHFIDEIVTYNYKYLNPLYVCPSNKLKQYKAINFEKSKPGRLETISQQKFGAFSIQHQELMDTFEKYYKYTESSTLKTCTVAKLIGKNCQSYSCKILPGCIIVDESTMLSEFDYEKIKQMYPYSKIYFLGDFSEDDKLISYQAIMDGEKCLSLKGRPFYKFDGDRRSEEGDKLIEFKQIVRQMMEGRTVRAVENLINSFKCKKIFVDELANEFKDGDYCIAYHEKVCTAVDDILKDKKPMYRIVQNLHAMNLYRGDIVDSVEGLNPSSYELRRCFTSHSIQGETIEPGTRVFILVRDLLADSLGRTFYTAISRVRRIDQLVFVYDRKRSVGKKTKREEVEVVHERVEEPELHMKEEFAPAPKRNNWMSEVKVQQSKSWF